jgi:hypothetical protein
LPLSLAVQIPEQYRKINILSGWVVFFISALVYISTLEPTASFWDCGEYIACAWGLESGHPPGAPFFLILGRVFGLFSMGNNENVAWWINCMSALASAATVMFLFWTITHLAKKIVLKRLDKFSQGRMVLIMICGMCGSLTYAFTDSFWFSAVEGEVYALSSFFTAVVFWAMLRWEGEADNPRSDRWIVLIAALVGLSIGVHLLNLLTIPALVFIFYFRRTEKITRLGLLKTFLLALLMLGGIQDILIPGIVKLAGKTELFFVNELGFRFNSGIIAFFGFVVALIGVGLWISVRRKIRWLNTTVLSFLVLLLGYSSFLVIVIRANAWTPINENNPSDPVSLLSYLNREQYGTWPILYGQQYSTPYDAEEPWSDGNPVYVKDTVSGQYIVSDERKGSVPNYDSRACVWFPRMWSSGHEAGYTNWVTVKGKEIVLEGEKNTTTVTIPTFTENAQFFVTYQMGWMYFRYFMWNFCGRQNDYAGGGGDAEGNWLSGIAPLDKWRLGNDELAPPTIQTNKANNTYFMLPFLLGIVGMFYHMTVSRRDALITGLLFTFTGLAIVFYLNQTPWQPRERDYAYVGSFYAWSIWIGLGIMYLYDLKNIFGRTVALATAVSLSGLIPGLVLVQNWDDHDRSGRTVARDVAISMLESCERNGILFTYADNDTFPLWYAQEVLGVRRDVRIVCLSLFRSDWHIDQAKRKQYDSDPLPISMEHWQYREGTRDWLSIESNDTMLLENVVDFFSTDDKQYQYETVNGNFVNYLPARTVILPADNDSGQIMWAIPGSYILKDQMIILDILAHNNWERPIHFAVNMPQSCYGGLGNFLQLEGLTYKLVPTYNMREDADLTERPQVNLEKTYNLFMKKFSWGGLSDPDVYADETTQRMFSDPYRYSCAITAHALCESGMNEQASGLIRTCVNNIPALQIAPDDYWISMVDAAYKSGDEILADSMATTAFNHFMGCVQWYKTMDNPSSDQYFKKDQIKMLYSIAEQYERESLISVWATRCFNAGIPLE